MPGSRHKILGHVFSGLCSRMNRTKQIGGDRDMETPLKRCLNTLDITLLGIGHMVGAGIYVLTGAVARDIAGPGIVLSFLIAGITSMLAALCYAEFGTRVPKAGSAYAYTYVSIGEFWAFVIGWNIILEHMIGAASVARAWSGYVDNLLGGTISNFTLHTVGELHEQLLGKYPDFLAFSLCILFTCLLATGVKSSAIANNLLTTANLAVMTLVIVVGFYYADFDNWFNEEHGFLPFGFSGVIAGAATCFYAFVGFDSIATSSEEARDPTFSIPVATVSSILLVSLGYILVSGALTLMIPFWQLNAEAALPEAFAHLPWTRIAVTLGALCGMTTTLLGSLFSLPRCMYAMAADGLIFAFLSKVNPTTQVPVINLIVSGFSSGLIALLFDLEKLVEFMSIGTLLAYTIVSASVIILRYRPELPQPILKRDDSSFSEPPTPLTPVSPSVELTVVGLAGSLRPDRQYLKLLVGKCNPGSAVTASVFLYSCFALALCLHLRWSSALTIPHDTVAWWQITITTFFIIAMLGCVLIMEGHEQNRINHGFKVPLVPWAPAISIICNLALMANLNILTWMRFIIWMAIGLLVYFLYGIHHSKENDPNSSYSVLLSSSEAGKFKWGAIGKNRGSIDTVPITEHEEIPQ